MCLCLSPSGPNSFHYQSISETVHMHLDCGGALAPHWLESNCRSLVHCGPSLGLTDTRTREPHRRCLRWVSGGGRFAGQLCRVGERLSYRRSSTRDEFRNSWCLTSTSDLRSTDLVSGVLWNALTLTKPAFFSLFSFWSVE